MGLTPAEGSLIFFVIYSIAITAALIAVLIICRKKNKSNQEARRRNARPSNNPLPYHENKSFEGDYPVNFVSPSNRRQYQLEVEPVGSGISTVENELQRQRKISRGEESLGSYKSVVDSHIEDLASMRSDSFHTIYDETFPQSSSSKNGRTKIYEENDFLEAIKDDSQIKKKKIAPKPPSISKAKVSCIPPSDGFIYENEPITSFHQSKTPSNIISKTEGKLFEFRVLEEEPKLSEKNSENEELPVLSQVQNNNPKNFLSNSKINLTSSSNSTINDELRIVNDERKDSDTSDRTLIVSETTPKRITVVSTESSDSETSTNDISQKIVQMDSNFQNNFQNNDKNLSFVDEDKNKKLESKSLSSDSDFSLSDGRIVSSTLRERGYEEISLEKSTILTLHRDIDNDVKPKMCEPIHENFSSASSDNGKDSSDTDYAKNISQTMKDMSITSEISTHSIQYQKVPVEGHFYREKDHDSKSVSSISSASSFSKGDDKNNFSSSNEDVVISISKNNDDATDVKVNSIKQLSPRYLRSSSSSSSDNEEFISSIKSKSPNDPQISFKSPIEIDVQSPPNIKLNNLKSQVSPKYVPLSQIKRQMGSLQYPKHQGNPDPSNFRLLQTVDNKMSFVEEIDNKDSMERNLESRIMKKFDNNIIMTSAPKILVETESSSSDNYDEHQLINVTRDMQTYELAEAILVENESLSDNSLSSDEGQQIKMMKRVSNSENRPIIPDIIPELSAEEYSDEQGSESKQNISNIQRKKSLSSSSDNEAVIKKCIPRCSSSSSEIIYSPPDPMEEIRQGHSKMWKKKLKRSKSLDSVSSSESVKSNSIHVNPIVDLFTSSTLPAREKSKTYAFDAKYPAFYSLNPNYRPVYRTLTLNYKKELPQRPLSTESL